MLSISAVCYVVICIQQVDFPLFLSASLSEFKWVGKSDLNSHSLLNDDSEVQKVYFSSPEVALTQVELYYRTFEENHFPLANSVEVLGLLYDVKSFQQMKNTIIYIQTFKDKGFWPCIRNKPLEKCPSLSFQLYRRELILSSILVTVIMLTHNITQGSYWGHL